MKFFKSLIYLSFSVLTLPISIDLAHAKNDKYKMKYSKMDRNRDGIVTSYEWRGDRNLFLSSDWNGDGVLSGNEAAGGARRGDDYDRHHSEDRFHDLDQNQDGVISADEWDGLDEALKRLDDDRNGVLTPMEFVNPKVDGTDSFTELDRDEDGFISRTEWNGNAATFKHLDKNHDAHLSRPEYSLPEKAWSYSF